MATNTMTGCNGVRCCDCGSYPWCKLDVSAYPSDEVVILGGDILPTIGSDGDLWQLTQS